MNQRASDTPTRAEGAAPPPGDTLDKEQTLQRLASAMFGTGGDAVRIGPYQLLERIGAGAMGVVYSAYDPALDRKVAIKLLHPDSSEGSTGHAQARLVLEARALARLSHPNVVTVHAVGEVERGVYLAMEFVEGETLGDWLESERRDWSDIVDRFVAAGRGLAAAHAAGIVHRDFKPQNVLIGTDGLVRVADFGVARAPSQPVIEGKHPLTASDADELETHAGAIVGTPAYMAPEQLDGSEVGPAADQFAYCVALFEALCGRLPHDASGLGPLVIAKVQGEHSFPTDDRTPKWLQRLVLRGLSPGPSARHPSMEALLEGLVSGRRRRSRSWIVAIAMSAVAVGAGTFAALGGATIDSADPCNHIEGNFAGIWDAPTRAQAHEVMLATGVGFAEETWSTVSEQIDRYTDAWVSAYGEACESFRNGADTKHEFEGRVECLDRALQALATVSELLRDADKQIVAQAGKLVAHLSPVDECGATSYSALTMVIVPENPEARERGRGIVARAKDLHILRAARRGRQVLPIIAELMSEIDTVEDGSARAEVQRLAGLVSDDPREAERLFRQALHDALRSRNDELAVAAYVDLIRNLTSRRRFQEAIDLGDTARAMTDRLASYVGRNRNLERSVTLLSGLIENNIGIAYRELGRSEAALAQFELALEIREPMRNEEPFRIASAHNNVGESLRERGQYVAAIEHYDAGIAIKEGSVGRTHPSTIAMVENRGAANLELGRYQDARNDFADAIERRDADHPLPLVGYNLGSLHLACGELDEASALFDRARADWTQRRGGTHPFVGVAIAAQGSVARRRGQLDEATEHGEAALTILRAAFPEPHPILASAIVDRGVTALALGRHGEAVVLAREALEVHAASAGLQQTAAALAQSLLGQALVAARKLDEADAAFVKGIETLDAIAPSHPELAGILMHRAELMTPANAVPLLERAIAIYESEPCDASALARARSALAGITTQRG